MQARRLCLTFAASFAALAVGGLALMRWAPDPAAGGAVLQAGLLAAGFGWVAWQTPAAREACRACGRRRDAGLDFCSACGQKDG